MSRQREREIFVYYLYVMLSHCSLAQVVKIFFAVTTYISYALQGYVTAHILWSKYLSKRFKESKQTLYELLFRSLIVLLTREWKELKIGDRHINDSICSTFSWLRCGHTRSVAVPLPGGLLLPVDTGPHLPWTAADLRAILHRLRSLALQAVDQSVAAALWLRYWHCGHLRQYYGHCASSVGGLVRGLSAVDISIFILTLSRSYKSN